MYNAKVRYALMWTLVILLLLGFITALNAQPLPPLNPSMPDNLQAQATEAIRSCVSLKIVEIGINGFASTPTANNGRAVFSMLPNDGSEDWEIYLWENNNLSRLTNDDIYNSSPVTNNYYVAWLSSSEVNHQIQDLYVWDGNQITQIDHPDFDFVQHDALVATTNGIAWSEGNYNGYPNIYYWDGSNRIQLTNNNRYNIVQAASGNRIVWWQYDGKDYEIWTWDGISTVQITNNNVDDKGADVYGNRVVWIQNSQNVMLWDGNSITSVGQTNYYKALVSQNYVAWSNTDGNDNEIFIWDGNQTQQITFNNTDDFLDDMGDNGTLLWSFFEESSIETYFWDGQAIHVESGSHNPALVGDYEILAPRYEDRDIQYANCRFEILDMDGNQVITPVDVVFVLNRIGLLPTGANAAADVNNDGVIDAADVEALLGNLGGVP